MKSKWEELCNYLGIQKSPSANGDWALPMFTAAKQLEIIEEFSNYDFSSYSYRLTDSSVLEWNASLSNLDINGYGSSFSEALSDLLRKLYDKMDKTEQEKLIGILWK